MFVSVFVFVSIFVFCICIYICILYLYCSAECSGSALTGDCSRPQAEQRLEIQPRTALLNIILLVIITILIPVILTAFISISIGFHIFERNRSDLSRGGVCAVKGD